MWKLDAEQTMQWCSVQTLENLIKDPEDHPRRTLDPETVGYTSVKKASTSDAQPVQSNKHNVDLHHHNFNTIFFL